MTLSRRSLLGASLLGLCAAAFAGMRPMRILILGGTGFTGPHQIRYALERGHHVTVFNRGKNSQQLPKSVERLVGDRATGDLRALAGREWDVCIDNPTTLPSWVRDAGQALHGRVRQYIFISTISTYADAAKPGDESAPLAKYPGADAMAETLESFHAHGELYGALKARSEQEARAKFPGMVTIIRPGLIVGPGDQTDRFTYWPVRLSRGGDVVAPGDGEDPVQVIDARDLAEWTIRLAEQRVFGTFNATGPAQPLSMSTMLKEIASATHSEAKLTWVPSKFLEAEKVDAWSDMPAWVPRQGEDGGLLRRSNAKAIAAGLMFRPLSVTAADTLEWFRQQTLERQAALKSGLSPERERKVLADWLASMQDFKTVNGRRRLNLT
jgi:2'-hydroxyisoflavone reductase